MVSMTEFTPLASLAGGVLIGLAVSLLLIGEGRIAGISGIASNTLLGKPGDRAWRAAFLAGLVLAGFVITHLGSITRVALREWRMTRTTQQLLTALASGLLFGAGLVVGGMTDRAR
jgi:uncharacterized membrane protein YedE/YeeE